LGTAEILTDECLQIHTPFKNFGNTTKKPTSLWLNVVTKVSGQLTDVGDYLLFKRVFTTFNFILSTPSISDFPIPDGKIVAVDPLPNVTYPRTYFDFPTNTWITEVKPKFTSTSDIFVTGEFISSSEGFQKLDGNTNTVVVGKFYCTKPFSDQWAHAIAAYQLQNPPSPPYEYVTVTYPGMADYTNEANKKGIVPINGTYRAATPLPILSYLVNGASGGGGNNYTGSKSSYQAFTACDPDETVTTTQRSSITSVIAEERPMQLQPSIMITPNPAANQFNLVFVPSQTGISKMEIFTMNGSKVMEADYGISEAGNRYSKTINVSKLVNGMYLVRVSNAGTVTNKKIVIAR
jgi:hypothetical protein